VEYLSSAGLRAIVKALQAAQAAGGGVKLASVSEPVETILRTVGMMEMLKMYPSVDEAVADFNYQQKRGQYECMEDERP
jgi:anti-sigma B factor antagonist